MLYKRLSKNVAKRKKQRSIKELTKCKKRNKEKETKKEDIKFIIGLQVGGFSQPNPNLVWTRSEVLNRI